MKNLAVAAAAAALLGGSVSARPAAPAPPTPTKTPGQAAKRAGAPAMPVDAQNRLVGQYCATCHSERGKAGGLVLAGFDAASIDKHPDVAERMIRKLRTGMMPPPNARRPEAAAIAQFVDALETRMDAAFALNPNPGWRPFQRLNRAEYQRAIKELLGIDVDVTAFLPPDTISKGFDNVADVQAFSPTLMESHLRAASQISRLAIGDRSASATSVTYKIGRNLSQMQHVEGAHPVSCLDCHDPATLQLRVTRPGFIRGIAALMAHQGRPDYDPNRDATRQEMRTYVCAQCHVEYYCGPKTTLFYPWNNGLKVEEIEAYYDAFRFPPEPGEKEGHRFFDWKHAETGAELLKAQHPEFEMYSQGVHARSGVACADCHMPYERQGATKVSDHWVRSPLLNIARACQPCHAIPEAELKFRAESIQSRNSALMTRSGAALTDLLDAIKGAKAAGIPAEQLAPVLELHRKAQWRLDFVAAENSMGFHAPQEAARILAESIDLARQAEILTLKTSKK